MPLLKYNTLLKVIVFVQSYFSQYVIIARFQYSVSVVCLSELMVSYIVIPLYGIKWHKAAAEQVSHIQNTYLACHFIFHIQDMHLAYHFIFHIQGIYLA